MPAAVAQDVVRRAFRLQRQGDLDGAAALYAGVLKADPGHFDSLHMLGVVRLRQERYLEGVDLLERACIVSGWRSRPCLFNLVRGLERLVLAIPEPTDALKRTVQAQRAAQAAIRSSEPAPLVSVLMPAFNHARFVREALNSVYAQTYRPIELIVIDDGSSDGTPRIIRDDLEHCPIPRQFVARGNRGAAATINECTTRCSGCYINVLNSDDAFTPDRIEKMVRAIHVAGAEWGFSRCTLIDEDGQLATEKDDARVTNLRMHASGITDLDHVSHHFVLANPAITTGNIFVSRSLVRKIGGFRDYRYDHDWAFCLEASWHSEPVMVDAELYRYRLHATNTISDAGSAAAQLEADRIVGDYCLRAEREVPINPLALSKFNFPARFALSRLMHLRGRVASGTGLRERIDEIRRLYRVHAPSVTAGARLP